MYTVIPIQDNEAKEVLHEYNAKDDAMHVDFDESVWLPCLPFVSLTAATIILAIIGAGIGIALSLADVELNDDWSEIVAFPGNVWV